MASISWFCCWHSRPSLCQFAASWDDKRQYCNGFDSPQRLRYSTISSSGPFYYKTIQQDQTQSSDSVSPIQQPYAANRRQLILNSALAAFTFPRTVPNGLAASDSDVRVYTDDENKFKIAIPQEWQVGKGEPNGFKSVTAFYSEENPSSNVSVVITGLGPDFTRMESFGKVEEFAETLVSGLDRSWQRPPGVAAKLIDCKAANGFYYIDYSLQNPSETRRYLYSAIGMASNGWYNRLYTVTGQFVEEDFSKYSSKIHQAVASFRFT